jgi:hypothetical protein
MGVELHVTRAIPSYSDEETLDGCISAAEWLAYVANDAELSIQSENMMNSPHFAIWAGESKYDSPWLDWYGGSISTKWPDTALYLKMLRIAAALNARVMDDEGTIYAAPGDWTFYPDQKAQAKPWWKIW